MIITILLFSVVFEINEKNLDKAISLAIDKLISEYYISQSVSDYNIFGMKVLPILLNNLKDKVFRVEKVKKGFKIEFVREEYNQIIRSGKGFAKIKIGLDTASLLLYPRVEILWGIDSTILIKNTGTYALEEISILLNDEGISTQKILKPDSVMEISADPWYSHTISLNGDNFSKTTELPAKVPIVFYPLINTDPEVFTESPVSTGIEIVNQTDTLIKSVVVYERTMFDGKISQGSDKTYTLNLNPKSDTVINFNRYKIPSNIKKVNILFEIKIGRFKKLLEYELNTTPSEALLDEEKPVSSGIKRKGIAFCYGYDLVDSTFLKRDATVILKEYLEKVFGINAKKIRRYLNFGQLLSDLQSFKNEETVIITICAHLEEKRGKYYLDNHPFFEALYQNLKRLTADTIILFLDIPFTGKKKPAISLKGFDNFAYFAAIYPVDEWKFADRHGMLTDFLIKNLNDKKIKNLNDLCADLKEKGNNKIYAQVGKYGSFLLRR